MLVGVAFLPPSFPPSRTFLHHKKAKLPKHLQHSVYTKAGAKCLGKIVCHILL